MSPDVAETKLRVNPMTPTARTAGGGGGFFSFARFRRTSKGEKEKDKRPRTTLPGSKHRAKAGERFRPMSPFSLFRSSKDKRGKKGSKNARAGSSRILKDEGSKRDSKMALVNVSLVGEPKEPSEDRSRLGGSAETGAKTARLQAHGSRMDIARALSKTMGAEPNLNSSGKKTNRKAAAEKKKSLHHFRHRSNSFSHSPSPVNVKRTVGKSVRRFTPSRLAFLQRQKSETSNSKIANIKENQQPEGIVSKDSKQISDVETSETHGSEKKHQSEKYSKDAVYPPVYSSWCRCIVLAG